MAERILVHTGRNGYFVVDLQTGATLSNFKGCSGRKYSATFFGSSPISSHLGANTSYFAVADAVRAFIHIYRTDKSDSPCQSNAVPEKLPAICFSPCGSICIAGGETGNLYGWDVGTGALLRCWRGHYKSVTAVLISPDGTSLFTSGDDSLVCCYNMADVLDSRGARLNEDPECAHRWSAHRAPVSTMTIASLGDQEMVLLTGSTDRVVHVWRPTFVSPIATYLLPSGICHIASSPTSLSNYVCCADGNIYVLNLGELVDRTRSAFRLTLTCPIDLSTTPAPSFSGHKGTVECCASNSDGSIVVSCGTDGIRIWDVQSKQTIKHLPNIGDTILGVSVFREDSHRTKHSSVGEGGSYRAVPFPMIKALQRTWSNIAQPPMIIRFSLESRFQQSVSRCLTPSLDELRRGQQCTSAIELASCDQLLSQADSIEAECLGRTVTTLKNDRERFNAAVCDMVDTLCQLPSTLPSTSDETDDDSFYRCALPDTPIAPSTVPIRKLFSPSSPQSRRLFAYVDRSLARLKRPHHEVVGQVDQSDDAELSQQPASDSNSEANSVAEMRSDDEEVPSSASSVIEDASSVVEDVSDSSLSNHTDPVQRQSSRPTSKRRKLLTLTTRSKKIDRIPPPKVNDISSDSTEGRALVTRIVSSRGGKWTPDPLDHCKPADLNQSDSLSTRESSSVAPRRSDLFKVVHFPHHQTNHFPHQTNHRSIFLSRRLHRLQRWKMAQRRRRSLHLEDPLNPSVL